MKFKENDVLIVIEDIGRPELYVGQIVLCLGKGMSPLYILIASDRTAEPKVIGSTPEYGAITKHEGANYYPDRFEKIGIL